MRSPETFLVIGGNRRMDSLARYLRREYPATRITEDSPLSSLPDYIPGSHLIFPMPFSRDGIHISGMEKSTLTIAQLPGLLEPKPASVFGGPLPDCIRQHCSELAVPAFDWTEMEDVALPNAVLTAEGAVAEAIQHTCRSLGNCRCLILGWGRCAQALARRLRYLVKDITVAARNPYQRLSAQSEGFSAAALSECDALLPDFDIIFNTIPAMILLGNKAAFLSPESVFLDLASGPLSAHIETASYRGNAVSCPGLPGKYFARDAGEILARAVLARIPTTL